MKFSNIYKNTEERAEKALLSLWTPGNHPMRSAFSDMLQKEPLLAEPVFQSLFGWETTNDNEWRNFLHQDVIEALHIGENYPPYLHQAKSWRALSDQSETKSIVVTSGTGSGKTECFMYPVLNHLYQHKQQGAIQAIFLYPLNALMEDQCDRLGKYCDELNLRFAVYNGNTPEYNADDGIHRSEVRTRNAIRNRDTTPQILLTNPSMLEYMLLRDADRDMIQRSQGQLKWIVIDEAHTYSGSAAVELANQILRILKAFGTSPDQVHFACTSATIGGSNSLHDFISFLTSQDQTDIEIIDGYRQIPVLNNDDLQECLNSNNILTTASKVQFLRNEINNSDGLTLKNIWNILKNPEEYSIESALNLVDQLCEAQCDDINGKPSSVLMTRAHFYMRTINGIYACVNPNCTHHTASSIGRITSYRSSICKHCGASMVELVQCKNCGKILLSGEFREQSMEIRSLEWIAPDENPFALCESEADSMGEDGNDDGYEIHEQWRAFMAGREKDGNGYQPLYPNIEVCSMHFQYDEAAQNVYIDANTNRPDCFVEAQNNGVLYCPECNTSMGKRNTKRFSIPVDMLNHIVAPVLLKETRENNSREWGRYITFTDSRQGTAISTKTFNVDVERTYARAHLVRFLQEKKANYQNTPEYQQKKANLDILKSLPADAINDNIQRMMAQLKADLDNANQPQRLTLELAESVSNITLCEHLAGVAEDSERFNEQWRAYKPAVMRNLIGRRPLRDVSVETMGFVTMVYPILEHIGRPNKILDYNQDHPDNQISDKDWRDFLKIAIDYVIRMGNHIQPFCEHEREYTRDYNISTPIFPADFIPNNPSHAINKWPLVDPDNPNRLVLLLCAAFGINSPEELRQENNMLLVQDLMKTTWDNLVDKGILTRVAANNQGYNDPRFYRDGRAATNTHGYYLDMAIKDADTPDNDVCKIKLLEEATYCPVTRRMLDVTFKGYSPTISGCLSKENFERFKCTQHYNMPNTLDDFAAVQLRNAGIWSDKYEEVLECNDVYVGAEHSGQQPRELLKHYTKEFSDDNYRVNILNCSTTMEMGVDIGTISLVLLDSVPPYAANYLQRAGRAGRSGQSRAVVLSMCNSTATGEHAFLHPMWALEAHVAMRTLKESKMIKQRHINSFFFQKFMSEEGGLRGTTRVSDFFEGGQPTICDTFVSKLNNYLNDNGVRASFNEVFPTTTFDIRITREKIVEIRDLYRFSLQQLTTAHVVALNENPQDDFKIRSIQHQILRLRNEMLIGYLAKNQFIPNANMPTGVVEFDHTTLTDLERKERILKRIQGLKDQLAEIRQRNPDNTSDIELIKSQIRDEQIRYDNLRRSTIASREARVALNEYAPGQTVVIGEKNFVSEGIQFYGDFDNSTPRKFIYWCRDCGHVQELDVILNNTQCPACRDNGQNHPYRSIIFPNRDHSYVLAYEPIGYRTYPFTSYDRHESTAKNYYNIRVQLLKLDWNNPIEDHLCQFVKADDGEVVYYNIGTGYGFAICKKCGKAAVDDESQNGLLGKHKKLIGNGDICHATHQKDIAHNVLLIGRHQTTLVALRFHKGPNLNTFITDEETVLSLGVMIKRALVDYLGINEGEIDFGVKQERNAMVLFIYDTNKGGCGYSTVLYNDTDRQRIFDKALDMILSYNCDCHSYENAACSHCLIDRETQFFAKKLSKAAALQWLVSQKSMNFPIPDNIRNQHPNAVYSFQSMRSVLLTAINNPNVTDITLCTLDSDIDIVEWNSRAGEIGRLLHNAKDNGKNVHIRLQYDPEQHSDIADKLALTKLDTALVDFDLKAVQLLGSMPTALIVKDIAGEKQYFLPAASDILNMTSAWGRNEREPLFVDSQVPAFTETTLPSMNDLMTMIDGDDKIVREESIAVERFYLGRFFKEAIAPALLNATDLTLIENILRGKHVQITYSDNFVNSALACEILFHLVKELKNTYALTIDSFKLKVSQDCENDKWNEYVSIGYNFPSPEERDNYLSELFDAENINLEFSPDLLSHHRWLKITTTEGQSVEIRPDHSIAGGWWSKIPYYDTHKINDNTYITKSHSDTDVVYYIIMRR